MYTSTFSTSFLYVRYTEKLLQFSREIIVENFLVDPSIGDVLTSEHILVRKDLSSNCFGESVNLFIRFLLAIERSL